MTTIIPCENHLDVEEANAIRFLSEWLYEPEAEAEGSDPDSDGYSYDLELAADYLAFDRFR